MRVLIDARMLIGRFSGVARVVTGLVDELASRRGIRVVALCGSESYGPWRNRPDIEMMTTGFDRVCRSPLRRVLWEATALSGIIRRAGVDLYHATWNHGVPAGCPVPTVLTIHDLIPWKVSVRGFRDYGARAAYRHAMRAAARRASVITTVSEFTRGRVLETLGLPPGKVATVPNGITLPPPGSARGASAKSPYVLYVGGHEPRKNVAAVLRAMRCYWERFGGKVALHLTGRRGDLAAEARHVYHHLHADAPVHFLGCLTDTALAEHYAKARAFVFLSTDEGFGLPVLEAMAYGCPVVVARRSALPELVANAGLLVEPEDGEEAAGALRRVLLDSPVRSDLIHRGRDRASVFTREAFAANMLRTYEQALSGQPQVGAAIHPLRRESKVAAYDGR